MNRTALHLVSGSRRRLALFGALVALVLAGAGTAMAYFTASGSGSGSAPVGSASSLTIGPATPTQGLYPGSSADLAATIDNPNSTSVHLSSLALDTSQGTNGFAVDQTHLNAGCTAAAADLSFTTQSNGGSGWTIPAKVGGTDGTLSLDLTGAVSMGSAAANACQGATFTVYLKVGP